jgi:hypothetical protein
MMELRIFSGFFGFPQHVLRRCGVSLTHFYQTGSDSRAMLRAADPPFASQNLRARLALRIGTSMRLQHLSLLEKSGTDLGLQCVSFPVPVHFPV